MCTYAGFLSGGGGGEHLPPLGHSRPPLELADLHVERAMPPPPNYILPFCPPLAQILKETLVCMYIFRQNMRIRKASELCKIFDYFHVTLSCNSVYHECVERY